MICKFCANNETESNKNDMCKACANVIAQSFVKIIQLLLPIYEADQLKINSSYASRLGRKLTKDEITNSNFCALTKLQQTVMLFLEKELPQNILFIVEWYKSSANVKWNDYSYYTKSIPETVSSPMRAANPITEPMIRIENTAPRGDRKSIFNFDDISINTNGPKHYYTN